MASDAAATAAAPSALGEEARAAWEQTFFAHRAITRETEKRLQDAGLPPLAWYDVIYTLLNSGDDSVECGMKQTALAARVQISPSGLSRLIDRMVAKGVVVRREVPGDRRAAELVVTNDGVALLEEIWTVYGGVLAEHFAPAVAGQEETVAKVYGDTADSLQGTCETRIAEAEAECDAAEAAVDAAEATVDAAARETDAPA
jgi:DNA-binding MarR family transcriptional regulator